MQPILQIARMPIDASHDVLLVATRGRNLDKARGIWPRICAQVINLEIFPVELTSEVLHEVFYLFSQQQKQHGKHPCGRNCSRLLWNVEDMRMRKSLMSMVSVLQEGKHSGKGFCWWLHSMDVWYIPLNSTQFRYWTHVGWPGTMFQIVQILHTWVRYCISSLNC